MSPHQAQAALAWLIDMGADEIIAETPFNRFISPAPVAAAPVQAIVQARAVPSTAEACNTLEDLQAALLNHEDFPLRKTASNLCFAGGNSTGEVMVIGDVPGRDEDIEGKVFAGQNLLLLEKMLGAIGLSADTVSFFNFIPWRPPGNRTPTDVEMQLCQPYILRAIELCQPRFILCLGGHPAQRLSGKSGGLLSLRGKWFELETGAKKFPVLPSFHPSYLLKQASQKRLAWRDLLLLKEAIDAH
ncbi:MAG: uracil-DNA glycosylase [Aestuariivirga sp.]